MLSPRKVSASGPIPARIMIVGEAPGEEEDRKGQPFIGPSGNELDKLLGEVGISRTECFVTNVLRYRPDRNDIEPFFYWNKTKVPSNFIKFRNIHVHPKLFEGINELRTEIATVKPNIVVALGNTPLYALTGNWGITKWRGSMIHVDGDNPVKLIPTIHPANLFRDWSQRGSIVYDLKKARRFIDGSPYPKPNWNFRIAPTYEEAMNVLERLLYKVRQGPLRISFDLETRFGHIDCAGVSWSLLDAICLPFLRGDNSDYWTAEQEAVIIYYLYLILTHPNAEVVGQNQLYDCQYTWRHWSFIPRVKQDTMISQHSIFSDLPKAIAFQASLYCNYYVYWKEEGKHRNPEIGDRSHWYYNCEDLVYTDEAGQVENAIVKKLGLEKIHQAQQDMFWPVLWTMQRGVKVDLKRRADLTAEVKGQLALRNQFLKDVLGHDLNTGSNGPNGQMQKLFYEDLGLPVQRTRATKNKPSRPTLDDDALQKLGKLEPIVRPLVNCIADIRTLRVFLSTFLESELDIDQRMRCSYNIGGSESGKSAPKTYRLSSSENAFGSGANLQNIPSEKSKSLGKAAARGNIAVLGDPYQLPNIRSIFVPDEGYVFFDGDLDRADLQVVAAEARDPQLLHALRIGADIHLMNAFLCVGREPPPIEELVETHPKYRDHRGPMKYQREFAKVFCHATNYGGKSRTVAAHTGRTIHEIDVAQKRWFQTNPGIAQWHLRTANQVRRFKFVENRFGYRWYIFDRTDEILPEALAWIPQSTVSNVINKIWMNLFLNLPKVEILLQVHDSLAGQFPDDGVDYAAEIEHHAQIPIPYDEPLIIPFSVKTSKESWGSCA
jgi:uracil-DNA glycosylase/DNA polymerase I-like protein with 3'-5' exonuclease and polymerase domains